MTTPPPDRPACSNADPQLFEFDLFYQQGIAVCGKCPVRAWCLREVDPIRYRFFEGVAGGHVWRDGYVIPQDEKTGKDPILLTYLNTRPARKDPNA